MGAPGVPRWRPSTFLLPWRPRGRARSGSPTFARPLHVRTARSSVGLLSSSTKTGWPPCRSCPALVGLPPAISHRPRRGSSQVGEAGLARVPTVAQRVDCRAADLQFARRASPFDQRRYWRPCAELPTCCRTPHGDVGGSMSRNLRETVRGWPRPGPAAMVCRGRRAALRRDVGIPCIVASDLTTSGVRVRWRPPRSSRLAERGVSNGRGVLLQAFDALARFAPLA